jgi:A/G-specific adenine glycosylase
LAWYRRHRRDLPWRRTRDPYAIWLSETMLQQTRVETVIPYYERFLARFPTVEALADAEPDDVMQHWAGLGYYGRARHLHAAAKRVAEQHGGALPDELEGLLALPGVGRYTAGAVASIAFDRPEPILDGNVARVLARILDLREDVATPAARRRLWAAAARLSDGPSPGDLNQALMELGALVCTPRAPRCLVCPVRERCAGLAAGNPEALPVKRRAAAPKPVAAVAALLERRGRVLAVRRPPKGLLGGLWELPGGEVAAGETPEAALARSLQEHVGISPEDARAAGVVRHAFTHRALALHVFVAGAAGGRVRLDGFDAHRWLPRAALSELPLSSVARRAVALALAFDG